MIDLDIIMPTQWYLTWLLAEMLEELQEHVESIDMANGKF